MLPISGSCITPECSSTIQKPFIQSKGKTADVTATFKNSAKISVEIDPEISQPLGEMQKLQTTQDQDNADVTCMQPVPVSLFVQEIRRQLQAAYDHVPYIKKKFIGNESARGLNPQTGTGEFSGKTQLIQTKTGNILAIIPFTGYLGPTLFPTFILSPSATSIQQATIKFKTIPKGIDIDLSKIDLTKTPLIKKNDIITKIFVDMFNKLASIPNSSEFVPKVNAKAQISNYAEAKIVNDKLTLNLTFTVMQEGESGLGMTIIPSAPGLDSITSEHLLGVSNEREGMYTLELVIPLEKAYLRELRLRTKYLDDLISRNKESKKVRKSKLESQAKLLYQVSR